MSTTRQGTNLPPLAADGGEVLAPFDRALFDAVPDPVTVLDWNGTVLAVNKAGIRAYKRPVEEIVGQPIHVLNPDLPRDHMAPDVRALLERVRRNSSLPVAIGFGISRPEHVTEACRHADAAVVGSALVNVIAEHGTNGAAVRAGEYVRWLTNGLRAK